MSEQLPPPQPQPPTRESRYVIVRDDGLQDDLAGRHFERYDDAHAVLERYYADLCCSDEREYYRIEAETPERGPA